jgi:TPR repeat protein
MKSLEFILTLFLLISINLSAQESSPHTPFSQKLEEKATKGDSQAQAELGDAYLAGRNTEKNEKKAIIWITKSAEQQNPYGLMLLGNCYAEGLGIEKDARKAFDYYNRSDRLGYLDATYNLGYHTENGLFGRKNYDEAIKYYEKCANSGDFVTATYLGEIYLNGSKIQKDLNKAFHWFEKAAQGGDAEGQYGYGYCYENGLGTSKKPKEARQWYQKAAKGNCGKAQYALGNLYYSENKFTKAKSLYEKAKKNKVILASEALLMAKKNISQEGLFRGISNLKWWGVLTMIVTLLSYFSGWIFVFGGFENTSKAKVIAFVFGVFGIVNLFIGPLIFIKMLKVFENPMGLIAYGLALALFLSGWLNAFSKKQIFKRLSYLFVLLGGFLLSGLIAIILYLIGNIFLDVFHGPSLFQCFFLTAVFSFGVLGVLRIGKKEESIQTWKNLCVLSSISGFVCALSAAFFLNEYYLSADSSKTDKLVYCLIHILLPTGLLISWKHFNPAARTASYLLCCIWIALITFRILQLVSVERSANDYLQSLTLIQKGEDLSKDKNLQKAKAAFQCASEIISNISRQKPDWETELVKYRLDDLNKKIMALDSQSSTNPQQNP